jgi:hypothetical protein
MVGVGGAERARCSAASLLPIIVSADVQKELLVSPGAVLKVDLAAETLTLPNGRAVRLGVHQHVWDELDVKA